MYLKFAEDIPENQYDYEDLEEILIRRPIPFFWKQTVSKKSKSRNRIEKSKQKEAIFSPTPKYVRILSLQNLRPGLSHSKILIRLEHTQHSGRGAPVSGKFKIFNDCFFNINEI